MTIQTTMQQYTTTIQTTIDNINSKDCTTTIQTTNDK